MHEQLFYIYSEEGERLGIKNRSLVHTEGDWHRGVQLNLTYRGYLLMQRRSHKVDIAKGLFDQTLATQLLVEDNEDDFLALRRGLLSELNVDLSELDIRHIAGPRKIVKYYEYDNTLCNREFVTLYQAELPYFLVSSNNEKVESLFWMSLDYVKKLLYKHPEKFTKTFAMWLREAM